MAGHMKKHTAGKWRLFAYGGIDPVTGKDIRLTKVIEAPHTKAGERQAAVALANLVIEAESTRDEARVAAPTVAAVAEQFLELKKRTVAGGSYLEYESHMRKYVVPNLGKLKVDKVRPSTLDAMYTKMLGQGSTAATVVKVHRSTRAMLNQAVRWQMIPGNPALAATPPQHRAADIEPPSPERLSAAFTKLDEIDVDMATYARLAATIGARRGELCALTWDNVDLKAGTVLIAASVAVQLDRSVDLAGTKTGSKHTVAIGPATVQMMKTHRARQLERCMALGVKPGRWVFPTDPSKPDVLPKPINWTRRWKRAQSKVGLDGVRIHDLRHFVATQLLGAGVDAVSVAGRLGHSTPALTLKTYAAFLPEKDRQSADLLDGIMAKAASGSGKQ